ncbi:hypothetical protein LCGC14_0890030 [marine sediment metagenome]|uniref:DUF3987 domain-containing protein n=1 Tax=marine sediment metagenome TaxID=412755 RepID=A0A0F9S6H5_9ZZZZ
MPFGLETQYPNLYILIVAAPGKCRKGPTVGLAKRMLSDLQLPVFVDSPTKRALTKFMHKISDTSHFEYAGKSMVQSPPILISKELSSFFAVDPKSMIEVLTDLYDFHADKWEYETSGEGKDTILCPCVNCLFATTPRWMAANLPEDAIGGGFTSRFVLVGAESKYKSVSLPPPINEGLYRDLLLDLGQISKLVGLFKWGEGALELYDEWYESVDSIVKKIKDERLHGNVYRMHTIAIKVAMSLSCSASSDLVITPEKMEQSITLLTDALRNAHLALGAHGRSKTGIDTDRIIRNLRDLYPGSISFKELLRYNYLNTNKEELNTVLEDCRAMGLVTSKLVGEEMHFKYKKGEK